MILFLSRIKQWKPFRAIIPDNVTNVQYIGVSNLKSTTWSIYLNAFIPIRERHDESCGTKLKVITQNLDQLLKRESNLFYSKNFIFEPKSQRFYSSRATSNDELEKSAQQVTPEFWMLNKNNNNSCQLHYNNSPATGILM